MIPNRNKVSCEPLHYVAKIKKSPYKFDSQFMIWSNFNGEYISKMMIWNNDGDSNY